MIQGNSGVSDEITLMPEVESRGVVEAKITSPQESICWLQPWPNIDGCVSLS